MQGYRKKELVEKLSQLNGTGLGCVDSYVNGLLSGPEFRKRSNHCGKVVDFPDLASKDVPDTGIARADV